MRVRIQILADDGTLITEIEGNATGAIDSPLVGETITDGVTNLYAWRWTPQCGPVKQSTENDT